MLRTTVLVACFIVCCQAKYLGKSREEISATIDGCKKKSGVDPAVYDKFKSGTDPADDKVKATVLCVATELGAMDDKGIINKQAVTDLVHGKFADDATEQKFLAECLVQKSTPVDTALDLFLCSKKYFKPKP